MTSFYKDQLLQKIGMGQTISTKEFSQMFNLKTSVSYKILCKLEKENFICKYGYLAKDGWEDVNHSNLKCNSLFWQICN